MNNSSIRNLKNDLQEAIYYLPPNYDLKILGKSIKAVFSEEGKEILMEWLIQTKNNIPPKFDEWWDDVSLTSYQKENVQKYLNDHVFKVAKEIGWLPKSVRKGQQTKKPPSKRAIQSKAEEIDHDKDTEAQLHISKAKQKKGNSKHYIPKHVINKFGGCYIHPALKKDAIPKSDPEFKGILQKIVDCEVHVLEAIEFVSDTQSRQGEDKEVKYVLEFTNKKGKHAIGIATHEELTTKTRFSNFLVSKGFVKFMGGTKEFDLFHEFLINGQDYPTIKTPLSWGEFKPGVFLFRNGIYDTKTNFFCEADDKGRIRYKDSYIVCPDGREQILSPKLRISNETTRSFLAEKFSLWDSFNGDVNVRSTLGYAVACVFSRIIKEKNSSFPLLFKFGIKGTGKSSSMDWFMALFGYPFGNRQTISKLNTIKGLARTMSLPRSYPFFLDDYRNSGSNSQAPNLTSSILNWYHRLGSFMALKTTDNKTSTTPMKACVVMTGNDKPEDPAALSRMIVLNYNKFLRREELNRLSEVTDHTDRFSEFLHLILCDYSNLKVLYGKYLETNKAYLRGQDFEGIASDNWAVVLATYSSRPLQVEGGI